MVKQLTLVIVLIGVMASPSSPRASRIAHAAQVAPRCLHGQSEALFNQLRRQAALALANAINRAQQGRPGFVPPVPRQYRPLEELPNLPKTPADFRLQFYTDGPTYTFSLKDTADPCRYAIFSDQDQGIYEATTTQPGVRVVPAETP